MYGGCRFIVKRGTAFMTEPAKGPVRFGVVFLFCLLWAGLTCMLSVSADAGQYLNSSHGNSTYGVLRSSVATSYARGNCAHCHELHASVQGSEPAPTGGPSAYGLFSDNFVSQTDNFCIKCHTGAGGYQSGGVIVNRSYSFRAGGWILDPVNNVASAFASVSPASSHNLGDILNVINGRWGYGSYSNPCAACHNPHAVQGDPANDPSGAKTSTSRGYPVSRPGQHGGTPWGLWGDTTAERMSAYTPNYQAPYRYGSTLTYEPDGSNIQDGSNLTDFVSLCTDCHNPGITIYSSTLGRDLIKIDWSVDKHGLADADGAIDMLGPYPATLGKVLSCTDCHEPHGSPNNYLLRAEVNGGELSGVVSTGTKDFGYLCRQCHQDDAVAEGGTVNAWEYAHHKSADKPYSQFKCNQCHGFSWNPINCRNCHFHGSWVDDPANSLDVAPSYTPTTRNTF